MRQVRAGAAAVLARGRDGGPDPGLRADPRGHHGHRRRLPDHPLRGDLQPGAGRPDCRGGGRRGHPALRCDRRLRQGRHQEGAGRLDHVADRLHDPRGRPRPDRLRLRHHAPGDPRLLQGRAVPRCRVGHARHERRGEHASLRRPAEVHAGHLRPLRPRLPGHHRLPRPVRLLLQGQDHRGGLRQGRHRGLDPRPVHPGRRRRHRVLHDPGDDPDLLRREALAAGRRGPRPAPARVAEDHDRPDDRAGLRLGLRRRAVRLPRVLPHLAGAGHRARGGQLPAHPAGGHPAHHRLHAGRRRALVPHVRPLRRPGGAAVRLPAHPGRPP